nr:MAG TPA: hypothetical protein [Caudoviricetes sp.]
MVRSPISWASFLVDKYVDKKMLQATKIINISCHEKTMI